MHEFLPHRHNGIHKCTSQVLLIKNALDPSIFPEFMMLSIGLFFKKNTSRTIWNIEESKDHITIELEVKSASGVLVPVFWGTTMHVICMLFHYLADVLLFWLIMDRQITSTQASRWSRRVTVGATCALTQIPQRNTLEPGATQVHYFPYSLV